MQNLKSSASALLFGTALLTWAGGAQASQWLTIDVPDGNGTYAAKINGHETIIGSTGSRKLFTRTKDGTIFTFGNPDDEIAGINIQGVVTGDTTTDGIHFYGFYMGSDDQVHQFGVQGSDQTLPAAINNRGDIFGQYDDGSFVRYADGTMQTFNFTTHMTALNNRRATAGLWSNNQFFIRTYDGQVYMPTIHSANSGIVVASLSDDNVAAGSFYDASNVRHGFVGQTDGTVVTFDAPGATGTWVTGMNDDHDLVGYYLDASNVYHGFTRTPDGTVRSFDAPGAQSTRFSGIAPNGMVVGTYVDDNGVSHGLRLNAVAAGFAIKK